MIFFWRFSQAVLKPLENFRSYVSYPRLFHYGRVATSMAWILPESYSVSNTVLPSGLTANSRGKRPVGICPRFALPLPARAALVSTTLMPVVLPVRLNRSESAVRMRLSPLTKANPTGEVPTVTEAIRARSGWEISLAVS